MFFGSYNNRGWGELNFDSILSRENYKWYVNENLTSMKEDITKYLRDSNSIIGEYDYNNQWSGEDHNSFISYFNGILDMPIFNNKCKSALHYRTGNMCCENDKEKFLYCTDAIFNHRIVEWLTRNHPDKITLCPIFM